MARRKPTDGYVGKEALTIVRLKNGTQAYVYAGQQVPSDVDDKELLRLIKGGFIVEVKKAEASTPTTPASGASTPASGGTSTAK